MDTLALISMPGNMEWIILLVIGLLLFGRRLPEVGRSLGKSIVEFKKGIKGIEDEIDEASSERPAPRRDLPAQKPGVATAPPRIEGESRAVSRAEEVPESHAANP